ncbi:MAG: FtsX-like permease family protein [Actinomycetota bacterium]|nr:FtsX-like permease family protein [Actinomycetota bacterium]
MTSLLSVKLGRDLRASWSRFLLMVLAIAISLTTFAAVLFAWAAAGRETSGAYASTEPASATYLLDEAIDAEQMARIAAEVGRQPGVIEAIGRTQFISEVEVDGQLLEIPLQVFVAAPDDPMRMVMFFMQERSWPPSAGEIFLGGDSMSLLGVSVGDTITIQAPNGEPLRLRIADTVYDPSLSPAPQEQTGRAYLSSAALATSAGPAAFDQLKIQVAAQGAQTPSRDRGAIVAVSGDVGAWLEREYGLAIREIQVPKPYAHPHQWQADALLLSLLAGGAAALVLSTMLVANMLNNLFTQQIPQIGIMKAIGARSGRIARLYLAMTLLVAGAATLLALAPAILLGRVAVGNFLGFLGIEPASLSAPWWTYVVVLAVGLGLPPLMALIPLVKASRTTVRSAIDHHGLGSTSSTATRVLARLSRFPRLDRGLLMALRNTIRRPARFLLAVGLLATAGMVFVAGMSLSSGTEAIAEEQQEQRTWDVDVQLSSSASADEITTILESVPDVSRIEALNVVQTGVAAPGQIPVTRTYPDQGHGRVSVTAISVADTMRPTPKLLEGRWLNPGETGAVVLNQVTRTNTVPGIRAGDTVQLIIGGRNTTWVVVGLVEEREGGGGGVYTTAEGLADAMGQPQRVNVLRIATDSRDEQTREAVAEAVDERLTAAGIEVRSSASISRSEAVSAGHLGPVILIMLGIALPLGVVGVIGLASTMGANVLDRTREFGVMHAIGARPKAVRRIVVAEGVLLAVTSCLVAVLPTLALTAVLGAGLGDLFFSAPLPYRISILAAAIWTAIVILGAMLATEAAASRASRLTVREALAYV